ncbi:neprilysin-1-like [Ostrea edulis]|uniref:neprilysin-1-like n=1 Tax=Ostrea edulis TaxID=37623 RepID=UPI0024AE8843|nr:neprilysin-1-like [Ostrea edulis]
MSTSKQDLTASSMTISDQDVDLGIKHTRKNSGSQRLYYLLGLVLIAIIAVSVALAVVVTREDEDDNKQSVQSGAEASNQRNRNIHPTASVKPTTTAAMMNDSNIITLTREVCNSPECVQAAAILLDSIDTSADPCDDFFQYACGQWRRKYVIPEDKAITSVFYHLEDDIAITLKYLLEKKTDADDIEAVLKAKKLYRSCMDLDEIEKENLTSARKMIQDLGGWPVLHTDWKENSFNLTNLLTAIRQYTNSPPLMDMHVLADSKNPSRNILYIDQPALGLPTKDFFLKGRDDSKLLAYEKYATEMAIIFGADSVAAAHDMKKLVDFEIDIANATVSYADRWDKEKLYNKMSIEDLHNKYPNFEWLQYFGATLGRHDLQITVNASTPVINRNPGYIDEIVNKLHTKEKRTVQNYVIWLTLKMMSGAMPQRVQDAYGDYREALTGSAIQPPRWKVCVGDVNERLGLAIGKPFLEEMFDSKAKYMADEMIEYLRSAMKDLLDSNEWMDTETKIKAKRKADQMQPKIGYPPEVKNDTLLNERYKDYEFDGKTYFDIVRTYLILGTKEQLQELLKPVDRNAWIMPPATVDAYFDPETNQIAFPAGILQPPCYKYGYPQYLNYGGIGYVIGHEITHGFDDRGRQYDGDGILKQWWSNTSVKNFKERADCISKQYSSYTVEDANKKLNGEQTLGENIADNGGVKESWLAYEKWLQKTRNGKPEPFLPGLDYTPEQLFFLNAAHSWCGLVRPEEAARRILVEIHSDYKSRVNGPLQNNKQFSKAFNCVSGSYMNPKHKCVVW